MGSHYLSTKPIKTRDAAARRLHAIEVEMHRILQIFPELRGRRNVLSRSAAADHAKPMGRRLTRPVEGLKDCD